MSASAQPTFASVLDEVRTLVASQLGASAGVYMVLVDLQTSRMHTASNLSKPVLTQLLTHQIKHLDEAFPFPASTEVKTD